MGVAMTAAMPFAVLGVIEVAGAAATELALVGLSAEALAGAGAGAMIGIGMVGTTAALLSSDSERTSKHMSVLCFSEDFTPQRPISAWRTWVACASPSLHSSPH
jgi:hypothetical protein